MGYEAKSVTRVAIVGLGPIGRKVAEALDHGIDGLVLAAVAVQNPEKHQGFLSGLSKIPPVLPIDGLVDVADIVCSPLVVVAGHVARAVADRQSRRAPPSTLAVTPHTCSTPLSSLFEDVTSPRRPRVAVSTPPLHQQHTENANA